MFSCKERHCDNYKYQIDYAYSWNYTNEIKYTDNGIKYIDENGKKTEATCYTIKEVNRYYCK